MSEVLRNTQPDRLQGAGAAAGALLITVEAANDGETWKSPFLSEEAGSVTEVTLGGQGNAKEDPGRKYIRQQWLTPPFEGLPPLNT